MKKTALLSVAAAMLLALICWPADKALAQPNNPYCPAQTFGTKNAVPTAGQWMLCLNSLEQYSVGQAQLPIAAPNQFYVGTGVLGQAAAGPLTGTSGATVPLNNGGFTQSGTANFTGPFQIGGVAQIYPGSGQLVGASDVQTLTNKSISAAEINSGFLGLAFGGTGSTNAGDTLQKISGVINASSCGYAASPSWCSGPDVGAWVNAAIAYANGLGWYAPKIILDPSSAYNQTTKITRSQNVTLDCQGSNLIWQSNSGAAIVAAGSGSIWRVGGIYNCKLSTANGWAAGHTNVAIYSGGDPSGVISPLNYLDAGDVFSNVECIGFYRCYAHGNNSWNNTIIQPVFHANYDGIYGQGVITAPITSFSIASNVVTFTAANNFTVGDYVNVYGLSTGTYLNGVSFQVASASSSQFTASFSHANVTTTSDSGTAYDGAYNFGEISHIYGGSISNNANFGMNLNSATENWALTQVHMDYNVGGAIGGSAPIVSLTGSYFEQSSGPIVKQIGSGAMSFAMSGGGMTLTGAGSNDYYILATSGSDSIGFYGVQFTAQHSVAEIVNSTSNGLGELCFIGNYVPQGNSSINLNISSNVTSGACGQSSINMSVASGVVPFSAATYATIGEHIYAPALPTSSYFCNQLSYNYRTDIAPNAEWCVYHGAGSGDNDKVTLGFIGATDIITADTSRVISLNGAIRNRVRVVSSGASDTVDSGSSPDYLVSWKSSSASAKSETIPACSSSIAGRVLKFKDGSGNAATYNIVVTPASGTIEGAASFSINTNFQSATVICDGGSNWLMN